MSVTLGDTPVERWQNKIHSVRQYLRGWARDQSGKYKKEKECLLQIIDDLDIKAENVPFSSSKREAKKGCRYEVGNLET
jgi:hypothetical protein